MPCCSALSPSTSLRGWFFSPARIRGSPATPDSIQAAAIKGGDKVLEVGSGSGYAGAVVSRIAAKVIGIERQHGLVGIARERLLRRRDCTDRPW